MKRPGESFSINISYLQKEYAMANVAKTKPSKRLKTLLCDKSLHDIQVFERGKDQIIYSCIYRYAAITLAEDMIPSPDPNGNYIDIDIGDHWWTNDVLIDYWELKIKDRALKKKVKASLSEEDDENAPFSRIWSAVNERTERVSIIAVCERKDEKER
jgi:hypothetical protein